MTTPTINANAIALARGFKYRLELYTANMGRAGHEFTVTKAAAKKRMRELRAVGYVPTTFRITPLGGLEFA